MQEINNQSPTDAPKQVSDPKDNTMVLRLPKPNMQVVVLGLVAVITLFQTVQLFNISGKAGSAQIKSAPATTSGAQGSGADNNADAPQSMVGGC